MFIRLIVSCDDFGRFDARPAVIKGKLFPLKSYEDQQIQSWLFELEKADLLFLYEVSGKPYLMMKSWEKYQYKRAKYSKYPPPLDRENSCQNLCTDSHTCAQLCEGENNRAQSCANAPDIRYTNNDIRITNNEDITSSSSTEILHTTILPKGERKSKNNQNVTCTKTMDGMDRFAENLEKPSTAAAYLMDMGIDLGDYFIAQQYRDFLDDGMEEETVMYAAYLAKSVNKVSWAYVKTILDSWFTKGIRTKAQAVEEEKKHKEERKDKNGQGTSRPGRMGQGKDGGDTGPRTVYTLKPRFAGHVYDENGNDITPGT